MASESGWLPEMVRGQWPMMVATGDSEGPPNMVTSESLDLMVADAGLSWLVVDSW